MLEQAIIGAAISALSGIVGFYLKGRFDLLHKRLDKMNEKYEKLSDKLEKLSHEHEEHKVAVAQKYISKKDFKEYIHGLEVRIENGFSDLKTQLRGLRKELKQEIKDKTA